MRPRANRTCSECLSRNRSRVSQASSTTPTTIIKSETLAAYSVITIIDMDLEQTMNAVRGRDLSISPIFMVTRQDLAAKPRTVFVESGLRTPMTGCTCHGRIASNSLPWRSSQINQEEARSSKPLIGAVEKCSASTVFTATSQNLQRLKCYVSYPHVLATCVQHPFSDNSSYTACEDSC